MAVVGAHCIRTQIDEGDSLLRSDAQAPGQGEIQDAWIELVVRHAVKEVVQSDGRIRRWAPIDEAGGRYLRVVLLQDGETVHNAFFDRRFTS